MSSKRVIAKRMGRRYKLQDVRVAGFAIEPEMVQFSIIQRSCKAGCYLYENNYKLQKRWRQQRRVGMMAYYNGLISDEF